MPTQFTFSASRFEDVKTIIENDFAIVNMRLALRGKRGQDPSPPRFTTGLSCPLTLVLLSLNPGELLF